MRLQAVAAKCSNVSPDFSVVRGKLYADQQHGQGLVLELKHNSGLFSETAFRLCDGAVKPMTLKSCKVQIYMYTLAVEVTAV